LICVNPRVLRAKFPDPFAAAPLEPFALQTVKVAPFREDFCAPDGTDGNAEGRARSLYP